MELVNLKTGTDTYQDEDGKTQTRDDYPWGLCISLDNDTLNRLGITTPPVGGMSDRQMLKSFWRQTDGVRGACLKPGCARQHSAAPDW